MRLRWKVLQRDAGNNLANSSRWNSLERKQTETFRNSRFCRHANWLRFFPQTNSNYSPKSDIHDLRPGETIIKILITCCSPSMRTEHVPDPKSMRFPDSSKDLIRDPVVSRSPDKRHIMDPEDRGRNWFIRARARGDRWSRDIYKDEASLSSIILRAPLSGNFLP